MRQLLVGLAVALLAILVLAGATAKARQETGHVTGGNPPPPQPIWVPNPSAGHYDCPDGWAAYSRTEPASFNSAFSANGVMDFRNYTIQTDANGHVIESRPAPGICVEDKK